MVSAIWSMPTDLAYEMPMSLFINFFQNHGLFKIKNRPQWYTVTGRSKVYVKKVLKNISGEYFKNYEIKSVHRNKDTVRLYYGSANEYFEYNKVIFATHADDTLKLIKNPTEKENFFLSNFKYKRNIAYLHNDERLMPTKKNAWSSWNSILDNNNIKNNCVTYWLNKLQNIKAIQKMLDGTHAFQTKKTHGFTDAKQKAEKNGGFDAIFTNEKGEVTEGGRSNIFIKSRGRFFTPKLSSGLLPGVMRQEILKNPKHPYTAGLLNSVPRLDLDPNIELPTIKGEVPNLAEFHEGCIFNSRCPNPTKECIEGKSEMGLIEIEPDHWVDKCCVNCK